MRVTPRGALGVEGSSMEILEVATREAPPQKSWPPLQPRLPRRRRYLVGFCWVGGIIVVAAAAAPVLAAAVAILGLLTIPCVVVTVLTLAAPVVAVLLWSESFLGSADLYTKMLLAAYKMKFFASEKRPPCATRDMRVARLRRRAPLRSDAAAYALGVRVPHFDEDEFSPAGDKPHTLRFIISAWLEAHLYLLPMNDCRGARFAVGEDPVRFVMKYVSDVYPVIRDAWPDKLSDFSLTKLCAFGIGAHRVEVVDEAGCEEKKSKDILKPKRYFVVRTNALAQFSVRPGYETYGGDAYFDAETWKIVKIVRRERTLPQTSPAWAAAQRSVTYYPDGSQAWAYAKFCFRSSLFSLVTLVDHLYHVHLAVGNVLVVASRESLGRDHPIRRFLVPFTFRTISVNSRASYNLIRPGTLGPRNFAFDDDGLQAAWAAAPKLCVFGAEVPAKSRLEFVRIVFDGAKYAALKRSAGLDTPHERYSAAYFDVLKTFASGYCSLYYPGGGADMALDHELMRFLAQFIDTTCRALGRSFGDATDADDAALTDLLANHLAPPQLKPQLIEELVVHALARSIDLVTRGHETVGCVPAYAQDVSFCAFRWRAGEFCGSKRTAITQALLMAFTSARMPKLLVEPGSPGDWTFLFLRGADGRVPRDVVQLFNDFQRRLKRFSQSCAKFNAETATRSFPWCYPLAGIDPIHLETSVSL
ncbi:hypothetical protein M885DRAFT_494433 [Pelagophyceae sp. CCMP2097]|nr:hypothetical protein M885DRAFT_494433 [Pelagophyceae sp. CCMP2097]